MVDTLFDGITARTVRTSRLAANVLERASEHPRRTVVFVHGNVSSSLFWQPTMLALPADVRAVAVDLRGFGGSEALAVDALRGVRDFSDDVASVVDELGIGAADFVGWSMGGGVVMQLMLDRGELVRSATFVSPVSPYGYGGTVGADGRMLTADGAGTGGGGANPEVVARIAAGDTSDESPFSPRNVFRSSYVKNAVGLPYEDVWVESMLSTVTREGNYPGDSSASESWPGFAPGARGVLNTMAPTNFNVSAIVGLEAKPPVLWIRGADDVIVGEPSGLDINHLGSLGYIPGWPGEQVAPAQPMLSQTRAVLDRYAANGGTYREVVFEECGHSAHLEHPERFLAELTTQLG
ncbi:pimeloyl-ACP methyl ester carboxylesterase [Homoserinimonas aerilata]|uniref:Pimeloyl-ACP methyl ester carboxylesterase n=1 Tax=Homoserinimonas aerilata TaxID=1162970 RepID=A0A542YK34_9MICO|nr:alpha/beta hydrolase [Homoserinimonas aerilata]TQL48466.1 pimeloyl-ACP methyl ester carboxylesterase [Homoserinimonas aerilata]